MLETRLPDWALKAPKRNEISTKYVLYKEFANIELGAITKLRKFGTIRVDSFT